MAGHVGTRRYTDHDRRFVYEVKKDAYKKYVEAHWGAWIEEDQLKYFDRFIERVKDDVYIIQSDGIDIGCYNGRMLGHGSYEIENICIVPGYRGRGIGTELLRGILEKYRDVDVEIQYFKENPVGALYERLGFERAGETDHHYRMIRPKRTS